MRKKTKKTESTPETTTEEWRDELVKCARAWARYVELTKKDLNFTEQAMYEAITKLTEAEYAESPDMADVFDARGAFENHRAAAEVMGQECLMIVVGYATGRDPFRLLGRVSADTGYEKMPMPELSATEMGPVAFAAKMAFAKVLRARKK